jgi:hypothetical protein
MKIKLLITALLLGSVTGNASVTMSGAALLNDDITGYSTGVFIASNSGSFDTSTVDNLVAGITLTAGTDLSGYTILGTGSVNAAGPTNSVLLAGITYDLGGSVATGNEIGVLVLETAVSSTVAGDSYFIYTNDWLIPADGANASLTGSGGPYTGSWTVFYPGIPEPSAYPVLAGLIAFGSALLRRRV